MEGAFGSAVTRRWPFLSAQNYLSAPARRGLERQWVIHHPGDDVAPWGVAERAGLASAGVLVGEQGAEDQRVVGPAAAPRGELVGPLRVGQELCQVGPAHHATAEVA